MFVAIRSYCKFVCMELYKDQIWNSIHFSYCENSYISYEILAVVYGYSCRQNLFNNNFN